MSANDVPAGDAMLGRVDMKLEVVVIPVSDMDHAKELYGKLGWRLDADFDNGDDFRELQFTPPGFGCSIIFGKNVIATVPGSAQGLYLTVPDIEAAREELVARGVDPTEVFHEASGVYTGSDQPSLFGRLRVSGPDPEHRSYRSFLLLQRSQRQRLVDAGDHDAVAWACRRRYDVRVGGDMSPQTLRCAAALHGRHEARAGQVDPNWPDRSAEFMVREQAGEELPNNDRKGC